MAEESILFTYLAPFVGVLLVAVGIGGAVPGGYAIIQEDISNCGDPTITVEGPEETAQRFNYSSPQLPTFEYEQLPESEQAAFDAARDDAIGEAHVEGAFPNGDAFREGALVTYEGEQYYATVVSENPCFVAPELQFPLGLFAIIFGVVGILTPPIYRKLVELERDVSLD